MILENELSDRTLRFDGVSIVDIEGAVEAIIRGVHPSMLRVKTESEEINLFNSEVIQNDMILVQSEEPINLSMVWLLPENYKNINLEQYIIDLFAGKIQSLKYSEIQENEAIERISSELHEIEVRGMSEFTKTIIYVLDTFREKDIVWGVGRGSSCASYVLFLLGLHSVDSIIYDVPMEEFFHD